MAIPDSSSQIPRNLNNAPIGETNKKYSYQIDNAGKLEITVMDANGYDVKKTFIVKRGGEALRDKNVVDQIVRSANSILQTLANQIHSRGEGIKILQNAQEKDQQSYELRVSITGDKTKIQKVFDKDRVENIEEHVTDKSMSKAAIGSTEKYKKMHKELSEFFQDFHPESVYSALDEIFNEVPVELSSLLTAEELPNGFRHMRLADILQLPDQEILLAVLKNIQEKMKQQIDLGKKLPGDKFESNPKKPHENPVLFAILQYIKRDRNGFAVENASNGKMVSCEQRFYTARNASPGTFRPDIAIPSINDKVGGLKNAPHPSNMGAVIVKDSSGKTHFSVARSGNLVTFNRQKELAEFCLEQQMSLDNKTGLRKINEDTYEFRPVMISHMDFVRGKGEREKLERMYHDREMWGDGITIKKTMQINNQEKEVTIIIRKPIMPSQLLSPGIRGSSRNAEVRESGKFIGAGQNSSNIANFVANNQLLHEYIQDRPTLNITKLQEASQGLNLALQKKLKLKDKNGHLINFINKETQLIDFGRIPVHKLLPSWWESIWNISCLDKAPFHEYQLVVADLLKTQYFNGNPQDRVMAEAFYARFFRKLPEAKDLQPVMQMAINIKLITQSLVGQDATQRRFSKSMNKMSNELLVIAKRAKKQHASPQVVKTLEQYAKDLLKINNTDNAFDISLKMKEIVNGLNKIAPEIDKKAINLSLSFEQELHAMDLIGHMGTICKGLNTADVENGISGLPLCVSCKSGTERTSLSAAHLVAMDMFELQTGKPYRPPQGKDLDPSHPDLLRFKSLYRQAIIQLGESMAVASRGVVGLKIGGGFKLAVAFGPGGGMREGNPAPYKYLLLPEDIKYLQSHPELQEKLELYETEPDVTGLKYSDLQANDKRQYRGQMNKIATFYGNSAKDIAEAAEMVKSSLIANPEALVVVNQKAKALIIEQLQISEKDLPNDLFDANLSLQIPMSNLKFSEKILGTEITRFEKLEEILDPNFPMWRVALLPNEQLKITNGSKKFIDTSISYNELLRTALQSIRHLQNEDERRRNGPRITAPTPEPSSMAVVDIVEELSVIDEANEGEEHVWSSKSDSVKTKDAEMSILRREVGLKFGEQSEEEKKKTVCELIQRGASSHGFIQHSPMLLAVELFLEGSREFRDDVIIQCIKKCIKRGNTDELKMLATVLADEYVYRKNRKYSREEVARHREEGIEYSKAVSKFVSELDSTNERQKKELSEQRAPSSHSHGIKTENRVEDKQDAVREEGVSLAFIEDFNTLPKEKFFSAFDAAGYVVRAATIGRLLDIEDNGIVHGHPAFQVAVSLFVRDIMNDDDRNNFFKDLQSPAHKGRLQKFSSSLNLYQDKDRDKIKKEYIEKIKNLYLK